MVCIECVENRAVSPFQGWTIGGGIPWALPRAMAVLAFQAEDGVAGVAPGACFQLTMDNGQRRADDTSLTWRASSQAGCSSAGREFSSVQ